MDSVMLELLPPPPEAVLRLGGFVFFCDHFTTVYSLIRMTFGLPGIFKESVERISPGLPLFVLDTDTDLLHGVYVATSNGGLDLDPSFCPNIERDGSLYPAQVHFNHLSHPFPPLPRDFFHRAVAHYAPTASCFLLTYGQAQLLMEVFCINWKCEMAIARYNAW